MNMNNLIGGSTLSDACVFVWQLSRIPGLGVKSFHRLYDYFSSAEAINAATYEEIIFSGVKPSVARLVADLNETFSVQDQKSFAEVLCWSEQAGNYLVCLEDVAYPDSLKETYCPPPILYLQGQLDSFRRSSLGVVGSRKPTLTGQKYASRFSKELSELGYCITSGLALGVDSLAHQAAINSGGVTCAVLGSGLNSVYPKQNRMLAEKILEQGVLVSEYPLDTPAVPANFPRRNRIISGLSDGVLVVEAGMNSGSLITAQFAVEQNKEVFAIPGALDNPLARGCHALIKQGAALVENVEDILNELGESQMNDMVTQAVGTVKGKSKSEISQEQVGTYHHLSKDEQKVVSVMGAQSTSFDDLVACLQINPSELNNLLVMLELKGVVSCVAGGYQRS